MSGSTRITLALLIGLVPLVLVVLGRLPSGEVSVLAQGMTNEQCAACHQQAWKDWQASYHAKAWTDPNVQASFQHFGFDRKCESCHAPEPVLVTGLDKLPVLRKTDQASGVNCLSCHALPDGQVAAARTVADAPCRPVESKLLLSSQSCASCHVAIYEDWLASRYAKEGKSCQSCHMPVPETASTQRSHLCLGGHDEKLVKSGVKMECKQEKQELVVQVTNTATGHNFPGERHNRLLLVQVIQRQTSGKITLAKQVLIKGITPFRGESSAERIRPDETFETRFPVVDGPVDVEVQLLYKLFPWQTDRDALVVHETKMTLTGTGTRPPVEAEEPPLKKE